VVSDAGAGRLVLYPAKASRAPSGERINAPSELAEPLMSSAFAPLSGTTMLCTNTPVVVYSSMKMVLPVLVRVCVPSPARSTARLPGVNGAAAVVKRRASAAPAASRRSQRRRPRQVLVGNAAVVVRRLAGWVLSRFRFIYRFGWY